MSEFTTKGVVELLEFEARSETLGNSRQNSFPEVLSCIDSRVISNSENLVQVKKGAIHE